MSIDHNVRYVCCDADLVIRLIAEPMAEQVIQLWEVWHADRREIVAPTLLRYEVTNAFYRSAMANSLPLELARELLSGALRLPIRFYDDLPLHTRALEHSRRFNLPAAYDAHYLALSETLGCCFSRAMPGCIAR